MSDETFGFKNGNLDDLRDLIATVMNIVPRKRDNTDWGEYYRYPGGDEDDSFLIENLIPPGLTDPDQAPEPGFLEFRYIFYVSPDHASPELTEVLLRAGARQLRAQGA